LTHFGNSIAKTYKSIQIEWIENIKVDAFKPEILKGGLEDIGNFQEGFCFRLVSKTEVIWNICADTMREKIQWMHDLENLIPHEDVKNRLGDPSQPSDIELPIKVQQPVEEDTDRDGEWIIL